jgi:hypothetical protein
MKKLRYILSYIFDRKFNIYEYGIIEGYISVKCRRNKINGKVESRYDEEKDLYIKVNKNIKNKFIINYEEIKIELKFCPKYNFNYESNPLNPCYCVIGGKYNYCGEFIEKRCKGCKVNLINI